MMGAFSALSNIVAPVYIVRPSYAEEKRSSLAPTGLRKRIQFQYPLQGHTHKSSMCITRYGL